MKKWQLLEAGLELSTSQNAEFHLNMLAPSHKSSVRVAKSTQRGPIILLGKRSRGI